MIQFIKNAKVLISVSCLLVLLTSASIITNDGRIGNDDRLDVIVIDAGHGGKDPGAVSARAKEKDIALSLALKLGNKIEQAYPDVKVIYTRKDDRFVKLRDRAKIANDAGADLFISMHCNSTNSPNPNGSETFVLGLHKNEENLAVAKRENSVILLEDDYEHHYDFDPNSKIGHIMLSMFQNNYLDQSISFASKIERNGVKSTDRLSRGVKQAGFLVLKEVFAPSVLVEAGFLSNHDEESYLMSHQGQEEITNSIFLAFKDYKAQVDKTLNTQSVSFESSTSKPTPSKKSKLPTYAQGNDKEENSKTSYTQKSASTSTQTAPQNKPEKNVVVTQQTSTPKSPPTVTTTDREVKTVVRKTLPKAEEKIEYFVQLAAASNKGTLSGEKWNQYNEKLLVRFENNMYKYQLGGYPTYSDAEKAKDQIKSSGFEDAFIIVYKGGAKISLEEAFADNN